LTAASTASLSQVAESRWILLANIFQRMEFRLAQGWRDCRSLHCGAFRVWLTKKQWGVSGQCRRELPYIQRRHSGPV